MISKIELGKIYIREYYEDSKWGAVPKTMYVVPVEIRKANTDDTIIYYYEMENPEQIVRAYDDEVFEYWSEVEIAKLD